MADLAIRQIELLKESADLGRGPVEALQEIALGQLRNYRFGPDRQDYFWVHDTTGKVLMHPTMPRIVGGSLHESPGPDSTYPVAEMTRIALRDGEGFVRYAWQYLDDTSRVEEKISHVRLFKPWGWVIGNGAYLTDVQEEVEAITSLLWKMALGVSLLILVIVAYTARYNYVIESKRLQAEHKREQVVRELQEALENVKTLKGLLPICSRCKKVRDDSGYWQNVEAYISDVTDTEFSHGLCPDCHEDSLEELRRMGIKPNRT
jgi:signal transduction histidine kinase